MMNYRRRLRIETKMRARGILLRTLFACLAVTVIGKILSVLGGFLASGILPYNMLTQETDLLNYFPDILKYMGIILGVMLISSPLTMGIYSWFYELSALRKQKISSIFNWMGDTRLIFKALSASLWFAALGMMWAVAYMIVPASLYFYLRVFAAGSNPMGMYSAGLLENVLLIAGIVLTATRVISYQPALFVLAGNPEMSVRKAFAECSRYMNGRRMEYFLFALSFLVWYLLATMTFGLMLLFVEPYYNIAMISYAQLIRGEWLVGTGQIKPEELNRPPEGE